MQVEDIAHEAGQPVDPPTRKGVAAVVITNPLAGRYQQDLSELLALGAEVGGFLAERLLAAMGCAGSEIDGYGKGAIVGLDGEIEHAAALIHPTFGGPVRAAIGGGKAIIPSTKLVASAGTRITMPIVNRDDVWVFDDMDAAAISIDDAPRPGEVLVALCFSIGGRPLARVGA